jgi:hypothetical protein
MRRLLSAAAALLCAFLCCPFSSGQISLRFITGLSRPGAAPARECIAQRDVFEESFSRFPHPSRWTFIIVCDDGAWRELMSRMGKQSGEHYGETNLAPDVRLTFLRGSTLLGQDDSLARGYRGVSAEFLVAHELAHIYSGTTNEDEADRLARQWVKTFTRRTVITETANSQKR